jgi:putative tricarboxylic transport membrane protein
MGKKGMIPAFAFLAIGVVALVTMIQLPFGTIHEPDSAFFPVLLSLLLIVLSLVVLARSILSKLTGPRLWGDQWQKLVPSVAALVAYAFLLKSVGYVICTFCILILVGKLEKCSWKATLLISVACTFLSYSVFRWYLKSPLPQGIVPF